MKTKLSRFNVDEKIAKEIIGTGDLVEIIERMEKLLEPDTTYQILDNSCCDGKTDSFKEINGETLQEKIDKIPYLTDFHAGWNVKLNDDNTLNAGWILKNNDKFYCVCSATVNRKKVRVSDLSKGNRSMPLTYCLCCSGHCRRHLEKLLGVQLKTKGAISSPINSKGQKPCEFIFEIII